MNCYQYHLAVEHYYLNLWIIDPYMTGFEHWIKYNTKGCEWNCTMYTMYNLPWSKSFKISFLNFMFWILIAFYKVSTFLNFVSILTFLPWLIVISLYFLFILILDITVTYFVWIRYDNYLSSDTLLKLQCTKKIHQFRLLRLKDYIRNNGIMVVCFSAYWFRDHGIESLNHGHVVRWERNKPKCFFTYIHLDLFGSHPSMFSCMTPVLVR